MIAYKVVRKDQAFSDTFCSLFVYGIGKTLYRVGENADLPLWLERIGHYPLLFERPLDALRFVFSRTDFYLKDIYFMDCEVSQPVDLPPVFASSSISNCSLSKPLPEGKFPEGTVSFKTVIPTKVYTLEGFALTYDLKYCYLGAKRKFGFAGMPYYELDHGINVYSFETFYVSNYMMFQNTSDVDNRYALICLRVDDRAVVVADIDRHDKIL